MMIGVNLIVLIPFTAPKNLAADLGAPWKPGPRRPESSQRGGPRLPARRAWACSDCTSRGRLRVDLGLAATQRNSRPGAAEDTALAPPPRRRLPSLTPSDVAADPRRRRRAASGCGAGTLSVGLR